jgi:4'-phosphopantetheinyl transferase
LAAIDWLICSAADVAVGVCLNDEAARPPSRRPPFLSLSEGKVLAKLRYPKRRREWLLGRWTAKQLLRRSYPAYRALPLTEISVANDPDGAPFFVVAGEGRLPLSLSISHRDDRAFCAIMSQLPPPDHSSRFGLLAVGADIERIEARDPAFVRDFFTAGEAERVLHCPDATRDALVTIIWSAKEAVLKVLRLGLTVDTRRVEIRSVAGYGDHLGLAGQDPIPQAWRAIEVECTLPNSFPLVAWWRLESGYALTLAARAHSGRPRPAP